MAADKRRVWINKFKYKLVEENYFWFKGRIKAVEWILLFNSIFIAIDLDTEAPRGALRLWYYSWKLHSNWILEEESVALSLFPELSSLRVIKIFIFFLIYEFLFLIL